jgi:acetyl-CoA acetyltransferase family protein
VARSVVLAGGVRTPFGRFGGKLAAYDVSRLAVPVVKEVMRRVGVAPEDVDHLVFGNTIHSTADAPFGARVVTLESGLPITTRSLGVIRACGTGLQAIVSAAEQIALGRSEVAVAAGAEVYSQAPHVIRARWGVKRGVPPVEDMLDWAYRDPFDGALMGETAERLSDYAGIGRERQDAYALESQRRTQRATELGYLAEEILPLPELAVDEFPRPHTTAEKLAGMPTPFREGGRVTPGNSSGVNDGAAAMMVLAEEAAERLGVQPWARIVDWAVVGCEPGLMGRGPVPATQAVFARTGLRAEDIDVAEINEAFAVVVLHAMDELGLDHERTNPNGGAISIGHPPGATGLRMMIAALNQLHRTGGRYGLVTMCLGAGQGMAMIVENLRGRAT